MEDKKGGIAAMIVSKMKPSKEGEASMEESPEEESSDYDMAASDIMDAVKSGDASMLARALKSFVSMCSVEKDDDSMES